jgi:iron complex transport system substrate-binding protein
MRRWLAFALVLLAALARAEIVLRDDRGVEARFAAPPQRIVSLLPSLTESVCALGACDRLVGVDRYSNWPQQVRKLPALGGLDDAQIERIVALRPDVVLAARSARVVERLEALGVRIVLLESDSHADVRRSLVALAQLLGVPERGLLLWAAIDAELTAAAARLPARWRGRRVYVEVDSTPYAAGAASFIGQTLDRVGLANVAPRELGAFPKLNPEFVVRVQPDVVIAAAQELAAMRARPGWRGLRALESGRTCAFETPQFELLIRPGPRLAEAARLVVDCLDRLP